jgi:glutamate-ammonia-ligase adenylyltransferase
MRLRPSGRQGPVATSIQSFRDYQMTEAWTWEHLALTRARPIAGNADLRAEFETLRREVLGAKSEGDTVLSDVAEMRTRLASAKPASGAWDAKNGPGRLMDVELAAQTGALLAGDAARRVEAQLRAGVKRKFLSQSDEQALLDAYRLCWRLQAGSRLLTDKALDMDSLGIGARAFLLRETGQVDLAALSQRLAEVLSAAEAVINRLYAAP